MSLILNKSLIHAVSYNTNLGYLNNMTNLQMKALGEVKLKREHGYMYIYTRLVFVPWVSDDKKEAKGLVKEFIRHLNHVITEV